MTLSDSKHLDSTGFKHILHLIRPIYKNTNTYAKFFSNLRLERLIKKTLKNNGKAEV